MQRINKSSINRQKSLLIQAIRILRDINKKQQNNRNQI
jgi:hypothetical protein